MCLMYLPFWKSIRYFPVRYHWQTSPHCTRNTGKLENTPVKKSDDLTKYRNLHFFQLNTGDLTLVTSSTCPSTTTRKTAFLSRLNSQTSKWEKAGICNPTMVLAYWLMLTIHDSCSSRKRTYCWSWADNRWNYFLSTYVLNSDCVMMTGIISLNEYEPRRIDSNQCG